jgi:multidrug efflux pump subunit AcrA (membrane-fusion protein)
MSVYKRVNELGKLFLLILPLSLLNACVQAQGQSANNNQPQSIPVKVTSLKKEIVDESSDFVASLESRQSITLQPRVEGQISKIFVKTGETVKAGMPLMEIDPARQRATVNGQAAKKASAQSDLANAKALLKTYEANLKAKQANLEFNRQQYERYKSLQADGAVSKQLLDQYSDSLATAQANVKVAKAQIEAQHSEIASKAKVVEELASNAEAQLVQLKYYTISAPFSGTIGNIPVKKGDFVNTSSQLATLTQNDTLEINIAIPLQQVPRVRVGTRVKLINDKNQPVATSQVFFVSPNVNHETQSVLVKARVNNPDRQLRANQFFKARVIWQQQPGIMIPITTISRVAGQNFVYVAEQKQGKMIAKQKAVKLGVIRGNHQQVLEGLSVSDKIVTSSLQKLSEGAVIAPET